MGLSNLEKEDGTSIAYHLIEGVEEDNIYTKDGTVDYHDNPANMLITGTWRACPYILGNECCERLAYYGISSNLLLYFKNQLNEHSVTASTNRSNWSGACYVTPLLGAYVADAYLGRYWTIASFSIIYALGMLLLTLSASVPGLKPICSEKDVCYATDFQTALCFISIYMVALGTGGIKPCVLSYGVDQFDDNDETERKYKSSFFNWFYFSINVGALVAHSLLVWIQDNVGWGWGFAIPTLAMAIAIVSFFSGTKLYRNQKPRGSPFTRLCQVIVASWRKRGTEMPDDSSLLYGVADAEFVTTESHKPNHIKDLTFFDKAAVETDLDYIKGSVDPWRLCTVTQVEELKSIVRLLPIWATGIMFSAVANQTGNLFVLQGSAMDIQLGNSTFEIPPATIGMFDTISVIFWIAVYDYFIVSFARRLTGHRSGLTQLQRMGTGLFISILAMLSAAVLEVVRLGIVRRHDYYELEHVPLSIFWQIPQYSIVGCAEVFTNIGHLEFFYDEAPDSMRSMSTALYLSMSAQGSYLSSLLVILVTSFSTRNGDPGWIPDNLNYGHLDYFFWLLAVLSAVNVGVFILVARRYTYKR